MFRENFPMKFFLDSHFSLTNKAISHDLVKPTSLFHPEADLADQISKGLREKGLTAFLEAQQSKPSHFANISLKMRLCIICLVDQTLLQHMPNIIEMCNILLKVKYLMHNITSSASRGFSILNFLQPITKIWI